MYSPYHTGYNELTRNHRSAHGLYDVEHMCEGAWSYIVDDFGDAVEPNSQTVAMLDVFK